MRGEIPRLGRQQGDQAHLDRGHWTALAPVVYGISDSLFVAKSISWELARGEMYLRSSFCHIRLSALLCTYTDDLMA